MHLEHVFLRSKVARRIFLLFIVSAFFPIVVFMLLSFGQINEILAAQQYEQLRQSAKGYGIALLDRLLLLKSELEWVAPAERVHAAVADRPRGFAALEVADWPRLDAANDQPAPLARLGRDDLAQLRAGRTLLFTDRRGDGAVTVYLIRPMGGRTGPERLLIATLDPDFIFPDEDLLQTDSRLCILDGTGQRLHCSRPDEFTADATAHPATGVAFRQGAQGEATVVGYWSIFLKTNFATPEWIVMLQETKAQTLLPLADFEAIAVAVTLLTLATVGLLSMVQIRRHLVPLERIMEGIRRIAGRRFDEPVRVASGDEFEELAGAVNQMSHTLHHQFQILTTLADIDRLILSSLKVEDIVRIVLARMREIVPHDLIALAVAERECQGRYRLYTTAEAGAAADPRGIAIRTIQLAPEDCSALALAPYRLLAPVTDAAPNLLAVPAAEVALALLLPLVVKTELAAVICLGYRTRDDLDSELLARARDFANRVTVALTNAGAEEELYQLAHYDTLTGLPNRLLLRDRLQQAIVGAERQQGAAALFFIDLDRFKYVNDSLGHMSGDALLREVAGRLQRVVRAGDSVARLGGDEFILLLEDLRDLKEAVTASTRLARDILDAFQAPFRVGERDIHASASIGIACYPADGDSPSDLLKNADAAMYHAKSLGKNTYQFYSSQLNASALQRLDLERHLRLALERGEFELHFQPKVAARDGRIRGAEALVRWNHPERGRISPLEFIPLCEELGLIVPLGDWIIEDACRQIRAWSEQGLATGRIAINLSPQQFRQADLLDRIRQIVARTGAPANRLEFEITESTAMADVQQCIETLRELRARGISISLDDFGTGFSSFSYLKQLPLERLKIDQSFVRHLADDPQDRTIVASIITLAHALGFSVVAEGVADQRQLRILQEMGCDDIQGYLFSPPVPAAEFARLVAHDAFSTLGGARRDASAVPSDLV